MADDAEQLHFMVRTAGWPGYWGRGPTLQRAVEAGKWFRKGDRVHLIMVDKGAYIDDFGALQYTRRERMGVGILGKNREGWHIHSLKDDAGRKDG